MINEIWARERIAELEAALVNLVEINRRDELADPSSQANDEWRQSAWGTARAALEAAP